MVGSFLNVVIYRYNTGKSAFSGRSFCFSCGKELRWHELIPLFSFIFLHGKCLKCGSKISWQYPIVELLTGLIFLAVFSLGFSWLWTFYYLAIMSLFVVIGVYDMKHFIIPDGVVYALGVLSVIPFIIISYLLESFSPFLALDFWAGPILFSFFFLFWFLSGGRWMGLGDAKLALPIGFLLGFNLGISAVILSFWIGALVAMAIMVFEKIRADVRSEKGLKNGPKNLTMKSEMPFAPFLILGFLIVFFFGINVLNF